MSKKISTKATLQEKETPMANKHVKRGSMLLQSGNCKLKPQHNRIWLPPQLEKWKQKVCSYRTLRTLGSGLTQPQRCWERGSDLASPGWAQEAQTRHPSNPTPSYGPSSPERPADTSKSDHGNIVCNNEGRKKEKPDAHGQKEWYLFYASVDSLPLRWQISLIDLQSQHNPH